jgi:hypothetical protein
MNMAEQHREDIITKAEVEAELDQLLGKIRSERQPNTRGVMLLTQFLAGLMLQYGNIDQSKLDAHEFMFWLTHNGDGTLITPAIKNA